MTLPDGGKPRPEVLQGCPICDLQDAGRIQEQGFYFMSHDRTLWLQGGYRRHWLAGEHGLVLAPGGSVREGPWIAAPLEATYVPAPTELELLTDWVTWIPEDDELEPEEEDMTEHGQLGVHADPDRDPARLRDRDREDGAVGDSRAIRGDVITPCPPWRRAVVSYVVEGEAVGVEEAATTSVPPISARMAESAGIESRSWRAITVQLGPTRMASNPRVSITSSQ